MLTARELFVRAEEFGRRTRRSTDAAATLSLRVRAQKLRRVAIRLKQVEDDPTFRMFVRRGQKEN